MFVLGVLVVVLHIIVGDAMPCSRLKCSGTSRPGTRVSTFRLEACDASHGIREGFLGPLPPFKPPGNRCKFTSNGWPGNNDIFCLQETHGKDEFLQALQVQHTQFRMFGTFVSDNVNAGGSAIFIHKNLLPDGAIINHVTTCQGRDHIVTIRSGESVLVIVNVHFEPDLVLRVLRETTRYFSSLATLP